uniref:Uncharacterized protein n=1 Tax=Arundo donax TaxID=35708 RepID=A0A0A9CN61_ARUDO
MQWSMVGGCLVLRGMLHFRYLPVLYIAEMSKTNGVAEVGGVMLTMMDLAAISHRLCRMAVQPRKMALQAELIMLQGCYSH